MNEPEKEIGICEKCKKLLSAKNDQVIDRYGNYSGGIRNLGTFLKYFLFVGNYKTNDSLIHHFIQAYVLERLIWELYERCNCLQFLEILHSNRQTFLLQHT